MAKLKYKKLTNKTGKNLCDDLWALLVKLKNNNQCMICGDTNLLNSHHLISRRVYKYRWNVDNGVCVCPGHHEFKLDLSFHTSPWAAEEWMKNNKPEQYKLWVENRNNISCGEDANWDEIYYKLEQEHKKITGSYLKIDRINEYILFINIDNINSMINNNKSIKEISQQYNMSEKTIKTFIDKNKLSKTKK